MGWLSKLMTGGAGDLVGQLGDVAQKFSDGHLGKKELLLEQQKLIAAHNAQVEMEITSTLQAKERVIVAELAQGDNYTKRARPTVIYCGPVIALVLIVMHYIAVFNQLEIPPPPHIEWFVTAWGGAFGTYAIGRSIEKRGYSNSLTGAITGRTNEASSLLT